MKKEDIEIEKAEQQILGWYSRNTGCSLSELCLSMGLTEKEYKKMVKLGMLDYLPLKFREEIVKTLTPIR
jgi:hypothetical protein